MSLKTDIMWRVTIAYYVFIIIGGGIFLRMSYLIFFESTELKDAASNQIYRKQVVEANRGDILASDGRLLATSVPYYEIRLDLLTESITEDIFRKDLDSLSICLSNLFKDRTASDYKKILKNAREEGNRYLLLKRRVSYDQFQKLKEFPIFRRGKYKGGFIAIESTLRIKPHGNLAERTIGYKTDDDNVADVGLEGAYDSYLKGQSGVRLMKRVAGKLWIPVDEDNEFKPIDGKDIVTTIDLNIQDVAENALMKELKKHEAHHGTAILMEVETGKIRAIANLERCSDGEYREVYNYAIGESVEPGSTFKLPSLMVALEDGVIDLDDTVDTGKGRIKYYDVNVTDTKRGGYGKITLQRVLEVSSNVGVSKVIFDNYKNRPRRFVDRLYEMGLNTKLGIEILGEGEPFIKYPSDRTWSGVTLPMMSFGYEVKLTPLQILTFYNAVANNGVMVKPMFVEKVLYHGSVVETYDPVVLNSSICSYKTIKKAKIMLEGVVDRGTATNLNNSSFKIAGKTGTTQIANTKFGYKSDDRIRHRASFCGYFPADKPRYTCIVVIAAPSPEIYYGNLVAGPVFSDIAEKVFSTRPELQVELSDSVASKDAPYSKVGNKKEIEAVLKELEVNSNSDKVASDWVVTNSSDSIVRMKGFDIDVERVPSVVGMGARDAVYILENIGLVVEMLGRGTVISQSLKPGEEALKGKHIVLEMSIL